MSLIPCDRCGERTKEKLAQVTWAWYRSDNERTAWRQRLCLACMATLVAPLWTSTAEWSLTCPACGIDTEHDMDPVYATMFIPNSGKMSMECPLCASCAARVRIEAQKGAVRLENRPLESRGQEPGPSTTAADTWAALGIVPRDR